jgi:methylmalonyl-CoA/ethylmalonyl-CoA epimerase
MRFHHLGILARTTAAGRRHLEDLLGPLEWTTPIEDPIQQVEVLFAVDASGLRWELVVPLLESSPVSVSLQSRKNILNHIAYTVASIDSEGQRLRERGHLPLGPAQPAAAFGGARIQFHLNPLGFIVELIENKKE